MSNMQHRTHARQREHNRAYILSVYEPVWPYSGLPAGTLWAPGARSLFGKSVGDPVGSRSCSAIDWEGRRVRLEPSSITLQLYAIMYQIHQLRERQ